MRRWPLAVAAAPLLLCRRWFGEVGDPEGREEGGGRFWIRRQAPKSFQPPLIISLHLKRQ